MKSSPGTVGREFRAVQTTNETPIVMINRGLLVDRRSSADSRQFINDERVSARLARNLEQELSFKSALD